MTNTIEKVSADDKQTVPTDGDIQEFIKTAPLAPLTGRKRHGTLTWPPPPYQKEGYVNRGSLLSFDVIFHLDYDVFLH
jgi:hypothetical protein